MDELPSSLNLPFIEDLYRKYLSDPQQVTAEWREFFRAIAGNGDTQSFQKAPAKRQIEPGPEASSRPDMDAELYRLVERLVYSYRAFGHLIAQIDPLGLPRPVPAELDPASHGFTADTLNHRLAGTDSSGPLSVATLIEQLKRSYCGPVGVEFMHIATSEIRNWVINRMESAASLPPLSVDEHRGVLERLTQATLFEEFIRRRFPGAKSFSLEGSESLITLLDFIIEHAAAAGVREIVFGMAHRGRLNVLANVIGKGADEIFREFDDADPEAFIGRGDVKYHLGHSSDRDTRAGKSVHLSLCFNPSHLGFIAPVAVGRVRAKQDRSGDTARTHGIAVVMHGDAGFIGEGVTQETLNLSGLEGYGAGGTLHIIINNQIGFTTTPHEGRSSTYASDVAKMLGTPIFHVNGENLDAVAQVARMAVDFRSTFKRDLVIDLYGYRRLGHNETDEPRFTQPELYHLIQRRAPLYRDYRERLVRAGVITESEAAALAARIGEDLERQLARARDKTLITVRDQTPQGIWRGYRGGRTETEGEIVTALDRTKLTNLLEVQTRLPEGFTPHPKIAQALQVRGAMARGERPLDWSAGEALAFASLATGGMRIRLSGQDSARGTFSQRHGVLHDFHNGHRYVPLQHLSADQAPVEFFNSPLSEVAVLGFDYGYSLDYPDALVLWEAQFGDFANAAQVIIDQFIASAEAKWRRLSGLVLLLPHGLEGMGPEHSSARLERFLQLAADDNLRIVVPSTPAQYYHCLRRQALSRWRKPLVIFTPKSLLRHPRAVSPLDEFARGGFQRVIASDKCAGVERVLLVGGKLYYELEALRRETRREGVAIIRLEELYPFPLETLQRVLVPVAAGTPTFWVQEEPENMGAWRYLCATVGGQLFNRLPLALIARPESPSPATGSVASHRLEQERLIKRALAIN
jgi:2-oxoglutarate dehydrogenase E1 component